MRLPLGRVAYSPKSSGGSEREAPDVSAEAVLVPCVHYAESRERSAELLRLALAHMGQQQAAFNPCSFALWYEHCAGLNPALSQALEAHLTRGEPLTDRQVFGLYEKHILSRDLRLQAGLREQLFRLLKDTAANTQRASDGACAFQDALTEHSTQLHPAASVESVQATVRDLSSETGRMRVITQALTERLQATTTEANELVQSLVQARAEAREDMLTRLKNRRGFEDCAARHVLEEGSLSGCALVLLDLDHFKLINDTYGHLLGDKVLQAVARVVQGLVKGRDTAARWGGDEFVVLLPQTPVEGALALAEQIRQAITGGRIRGGPERAGPAQVTASIGVAGAQPHDSLESLLSRADRALYSAKRAGRNQVACQLADSDDGPDSTS